MPKRAKANPGDSSSEWILGTRPRKTRTVYHVFVRREVVTRFGVDRRIVPKVHQRQSPAER